MTHVKQHPTHFSPVTISEGVYAAISSPDMMPVLMPVL